MDDEYGPRGEVHESQDSLMGIKDLIRIGTSALGAFLIIVGLIYAIVVFGVVRDLIESPDAFVANLDAWVGPEVAEEPAPAAVSEVVETVPSVAEPEASGEAATDELAPLPNEDPATGEEVVESGSSGNAREVLEGQDLSGNQSSRSVPRVRREPATEAETVLEEILDLIREGRMGRIAGAVIIFLFVLVLVQIPLAVIRIGVQLLIAAGGYKGSGR